MENKIEKKLEQLFLGEFFTSEEELFDNINYEMKDLLFNFIEDSSYTLIDKSIDTDYCLDMFFRQFGEEENEIEEYNVMVYFNEDFKITKNNYFNEDFKITEINVFLETYEESAIY